MKSEFSGQLRSYPASKDQHRSVSVDDGRLYNQQSHYWSLLGFVFRTITVDNISIQCGTEHGYIIEQYLHNVSIQFISTAIERSGRWIIIGLPLRASDFDCYKLSLEDVLHTAIICCGTLMFQNNFLVTAGLFSITQLLEYGFAGVCRLACTCKICISFTGFYVGWQRTEDQMFSE